MDETTVLSPNDMHFVDLSPIELGLDRRESEKKLSTRASISGPFHVLAEIVIGRPMDPNVLALPGGQQELVTLCLRCSFAPHIDAEFRGAWVIFRTTTAEEEVIVEHAFPREILQEIKGVLSYKVKSGFEFSPLEGIVGVEHKTQIVKYLPEIFVTGEGTSGIRWDLRSTRSKQLAGMRYLFLAFRRRKGEAVICSVEAGAEITSKYGPIPLYRRRKERAAVLRLRIK